jgi:Xaa-Pro aminopeptidase
MNTLSAAHGQIRIACEVTDRCFVSLLAHITPGVTEGNLTKYILSYLQKHGAQPAFPPITAFGEHTSVVHYKDSHLSKTKCRKSEIILLDFGAKVNGYCADMTRIVFVGKPKKEWIRAYKTVLTVQRAILDTLDSRVGKKKSFSGAELDRTAKDMIAGAGFPPYKHSLGHAIGKKVHEPPKLSVKKDARILPGLVFTIEPGIYIEGSYGIRIEDLVRLKKDGLEILSKSPREMIIL